MIVTSGAGIGSPLCITGGGGGASTIPGGGGGGGGCIAETLTAVRNKPKPIIFFMKGSCQVLCYS